MIKVSSQRDPLVMWGCQCCSQDLRYYPDRSGHCHSSSPSEASALFSKVLCQPLSTGTALMRQFGPGKVSAGWEVHISSASPFFFQHTCWTTAPVQSLAMNQEKALAPLWVAGSPVSQIRQSTSPIASYSWVVLKGALGGTHAPGQLPGPTRPSPKRDGQAAQVQVTVIV